MANLDPKQFEEYRQRYQEHLRAIDDPKLTSWVGRLSKLAENQIQPEKHGTLLKWLSALDRLPPEGELRLDQDLQAVHVDGEELNPVALSSTLMEFHPWRKGPFKFFGVDIDTEWRSDLKWDRIKDQIDFRGKRILDVGCGNGYYGWRMLAAGAESVVGCDPTLLYLMQFEVFRRYAQDAKHWVLPVADTEIPDDLRAFDLAFSMGVLYHRTSPIDHLKKMVSTLKPGGQLVLETLIIESDEPTVLVPKDRYAKMRNVWFIPSIPMLEIWLSRVGLKDIQVLSVDKTTSQEQRRTDWMTFESLEDFLANDSDQKTLEGYQSPSRTVVVCSV